MVSEAIGIPIAIPRFQPVSTTGPRRKVGPGNTDGTRRHNNYRRNWPAWEAEGGTEDGARRRPKEGCVVLACAGPVSSRLRPNEKSVAVSWNLPHFAESYKSPDC